MLDRFRKYDEIIDKMNSDYGLSMLELEIYYDVKLSNNNLTDSELVLVVDSVMEAYLKSEDIDLEKIVYVALDNLNELEDMSTWDLLDKCVW